jgi:hypothetical protein
MQIITIADREKESGPRHPSRLELAGIALDLAQYYADGGDVRQARLWCQVANDPLLGETREDRKKRLKAEKTKGGVE